LFPDIPKEGWTAQTSATMTNTRNIVILPIQAAPLANQPKDRLVASLGFCGTFCFFFPLCLVFFCSLPCKARLTQCHHGDCRIHCLPSPQRCRSIDVRIKLQWDGRKRRSKYKRCSTGASAGIGKATALQFAACGASVVRICFSAAPSLGQRCDGQLCRRN
jgi:hypothetical protein